MADLGAEIADALAQHRIVCRQSMEFLNALPDGTRREAFDTFRQNYFFRTATTPQSVALVLLAAARQRDLETMADAALNIYQEAGSGDPAAAHLRLMEESHNRLAADIYDLPPLAIVDADKFPLVTAATREFRQTQEQLYSAGDYCRTLGASYAQESAAVDMMQAILDFMFAPYADRYNGPDYVRLTEYFSCHLDGVEEQHAEMALGALMRNCERIDGGTRSALDGAHRFLAVQSRIWVALTEPFGAGAR